MRKKEIWNTEFSAEGCLVFMVIDVRDSGGRKGVYRVQEVDFWSIDLLR